MLFYMKVFFFKLMTADDMRISDWSSDVCSSDLITGGGLPCVAQPRTRPSRPAGSPAKRFYGKDHSWLGSFGRIQFAAPRQAVDVDAQGRSEASGVGKEGVQTCRCRW